MSVLYPTLAFISPSTLNQRNVWASVLRNSHLAFISPSTANERNVCASVFRNSHTNLFFAFYFFRSIQWHGSQMQEHFKSNNIYTIHARRPKNHYQIFSRWSFSYWTSFGVKLLYSYFVYKSFVSWHIVLASSQLSQCYKQCLTWEKSNKSNFTSWLLNKVALFPVQHQLLKVAYILNVKIAKPTTTDYPQQLDYHSILSHFQLHAPSSITQLKTIVYDVLDWKFFQFSETQTENDKLSLEVQFFENLWRVRSFFQSLHEIGLGYVEGNHRGVLASKLMYGQQIHSPYPFYYKFNRKEKNRTPFPPKDSPLFLLDSKSQWFFHVYLKFQNILSTPMALLLRCYKYALRRVLKSVSEKPFT